MMTWETSNSMKCYTLPTKKIKTKIIGFIKKKIYWEKYTRKKYECAKIKSC